MIRVELKLRDQRYAYTLDDDRTITQIVSIARNYTRQIIWHTGIKHSTESSSAERAITQFFEQSTEFYWLRTDDGEWIGVSQADWIQAERRAGLRPKSISINDPLYLTTCATSGFTHRVRGKNIEGKITQEPKPPR